jgi:TM2 domain-containing membrane protein YozV
MSSVAFPSSGAFCFACGQPIDARAELCPKCGVRQKTATGQKSRTTAALLALFLGGIGVHKFYLGRIGQGFLYLIFFWTFIPAIVAFVEFIIYICMSDEAFSAKYG